MADFIFHDHESIWLMIPQNDNAREFAADVLPEDTPMHGTGYAIEARYVTWTVESLRKDGFTCEKGD